MEIMINIIKKNINTGGDPKILKTALESFKWNE